MPTILAEDFPNCGLSGTVATLYLHSKQPFKAADGTPVIAGKFPSENWEHKIACTIEGGDLKVPAENVEATTNSDNPTNVWVATLVDQFDEVHNFYLKKFALPPGNGGQITWNQIREYNVLPEVVAELGLTTDNVPEGTENLYFREDRVLEVVGENVQLKSEKGQNNGYAPLDLTGKVPTQFLPPFTINNVTAVANQAARLALNAVIGHAAKEADTGETFMLSVLPATDNANWIKISDISPDWGVITNKPSFGTASLLNVPATGNAAAGEVVKGNDSRFVPAGGTAHQILAKVNNTDFNTEWVDAPEGTGGATGEIPFLDDSDVEDNIPLVGGVGEGGTGAVDSVNGLDGVVVLTTDEIAEGATNKYFTDEKAQDAVGAALTDTATIDFTYNDGSNQIFADVKDASIGDAKIAAGIAQSKITNLTTDLAAKAPIASPAFSGNPTVPNQSAGNNSTRAANTAYVDAAIALLIASAPGLLDTLDEIAAALGDDPNFATTMTTALTGKLAKASNLSDLTDPAAARTNLGLGAVALLASIATANIQNQAVTYGKIQNVSGPEKILGRVSAGAGTVEEISTTSFGRSILAAADALAARISLGLGNLALYNNVSTALIQNDAVTPSKLAEYVHTGTSGTGSIDASAGFSFGFDNNTSALAISNPTNCNEAGQTISIVIYNSSGGAMAVNLSVTGTNCFKFTTDVPSIDNIPAGEMIFIVAKYDAFYSKWRVIGYTKGGAI